jgi:hypothetical protein
MRYSYGLYLMATICFLLAFFFFMGYAGYIKLTISEETTALVITMFSAVLGVVFVVIGYGVRQKKAVATQPPSPKLSVKTKSRVAISDSGRCPKCGSEVASPRKTWKMAGRPDKAGKRTELTIGLFDCPKCKKPFRVVLDKRKI